MAGFSQKSQNLHNIKLLFDLLYFYYTYSHLKRIIRRFRHILFPFHIAVTVNTMEGLPEDIAKIKQHYPLEKCRKHLELIHLLFNHGKEKKVGSAVCLFKLLERGYLAAMMGFVLTGDHRNYKKQFKNDALNFAKAAIKFVKILPKECVDEASLKRIIEDLELPLCYPGYSKDTTSQINNPNAQKIYVNTL